MTQPIMTHPSQGPCDGAGVDRSRFVPCLLGDSAAFTRREVRAFQNEKLRSWFDNGRSESDGFLGDDDLEIEADRGATCQYSGCRDGSMPCEAHPIPGWSHEVAGEGWAMSPLELMRDLGLLRGPTWSAVD